jgi:hypothetical protein
MCKHGGVPGIDWRNEFCHAVATAAIEQPEFLSLSIPYFRRPGAGIVVGCLAVFNANSQHANNAGKGRRGGHSALVSGPPPCQEVLLPVDATDLPAWRAASFLLLDDRARTDGMDPWSFGLAKWYRARSSLGPGKSAIRIQKPSEK